MKIKHLLVILVIATFTFINVAGASIITFDGLVGNNGDPVATYVEDGFTVTSLGSWLEAHAWGNPVPDIFTRYSGNNSQSVTVTTSGLFVFNSADFSTGFGEANYTIRGLLSGVDQFVALTGSDSYPNWTTVLGDGTTAIDTLIITQTQGSSSSANIDNISVTTTSVPEPTTMLLLGLGLVGLAGVRRTFKK